MKKFKRILAICLSLIFFTSLAWAGELDLLMAKAPYRIYQSGPEIKVLEQLLYEKGYLTKNPDEYFDFVTYQAVKNVQRQMGKYPSGVADAQTISFLAGYKPVTTAPVTPSTQPTSISGNFTVPEGSKLDVSSVLYPLTQDEIKLMKLINEERVKVGIAPLQFDYRLTLTARLKSKDMIKNNYFGHVSKTYGASWAMMSAVGVRYLTAGENIAGTWAVERAHNNFMNSSGHRANILNPKFTHYGVGIISGGPYGMMFTEHFAQE